jgi:drug/metabolite transporter (DMT)-like permease
MRTLYTWMAIALITCASTAGEVTLAYSMRRIGDLGALRARSGLWACVRRVATSGRVYLAVCFMAVGFFSLLFGLSWADLSLVGPAAAALTFISNAFAAKFLLHENVDRRRWIASVFVAAGVALLTL